MAANTDAAIRVLSKYLQRQGLEAAMRTGAARQAAYSRVQGAIDALDCLREAVRGHAPAAPAVSVSEKEK